MIKNENAKKCQNNKRNSAALMKRVYNLAASEPLWQPWMIKRFVMKINAEFALFNLVLSYTCVGRYRCHSNISTSCTRSMEPMVQGLRWDFQIRVNPIQSRVILFTFHSLQGTWDYWHTYDRWVIGPNHGKAWGGIMIKPYDYATLCPWKLKWFRSQRWWEQREVFAPIEIGL